MPAAKKKGALQRFLATYSNSSTVKSYTWCLEKYFGSVYGEGNKKNKISLEDLAERYFNEKRDCQDDITSFFSSINTSPPKTVALAMSAVRTFLSENDVELPEKFWRKLRRRKKGTRALSMEKIPSNLQLRMIFSHLSIQGRALYLVLESSGMRIGETLKLAIDDLDLDSDPARIALRANYTKSGNPRIAFISSEAKEALVEWLKVRKSYANGKRTSPSSKRSNQATTKKKEEDDFLLFPFSLNNSHVMWRNAVRKAKLLLKDKTTKRYTIHPHVLRKFFRTRMATLIPADVVEALMGHERYLTEVYRKYSEEDLAKFYKQGESAVLVFASAGAEELGDLRKQVEDKSKQLSEVVSALAVENTEQKKRIAILEAKVRQIELLENTVGTLREQLMNIGTRQATFDAMVSAVLNPKDMHRKFLSQNDLAKIRELLVQRTK